MRRTLVWGLMVGLGALVLSCGPGIMKANAQCGCGGGAPMAADPSCGCCEEPCGECCPCYHRRCGAVELLAPVGWALRLLGCNCGCNGCDCETYWPDYGCRPSDRCNPCCGDQWCGHPCCEGCMAAPPCGCSGMSGGHGCGCGGGYGGGYGMNATPYDGYETGVVTRSGGPQYASRRPTVSAPQYSTSAPQYSTRPAYVPAQPTYADHRPSPHRRPLACVSP